MAELETIRVAATIAAAFAAAASAVAAWLSYSTARRALATSERVRREGLRPALVVVKDKAGKWTLHNVGRGPALNITIAVRERGTAWASRGAFSPQAPGAGLEIPWAVGPRAEHEVGAVYEDALGDRLHTLLSGRFDHRIVEGDPPGIRNAREPGEVAADLQAHGEVDKAQSLHMLDLLDNAPKPRR